MKAQVAQVHKQMLHPKYPCFVHLSLFSHYPLFLLLKRLARDTDVNGTSNHVHVSTERCQPLLQALRIA
jgi:hypothetical protein